MEQLNKYHWEIAPEPDRDTVMRLADALDIPLTAAGFLVTRKHETPGAARAFLFPDDTPPHDPFLFARMEDAVECLQRAIAERKRILIHGDYDVDGISGTAVLFHFLHTLVPHVFRFVPDRRKDGYGVAARAVEWAIEQRVGLVIAVDCGTSDGALIARLEEAGIDVIVCDHHEFPVDGGTRGIILNPAGAGESYPFSGLCGTGVAFKLLAALEARGTAGATSTKELLDLVAMATVGDLAPLVDENRFFARAGLRLLSQNGRAGLKALRNVARLDAPEITASHISFTIAPRLNAPGRVSNPKPALEILCASDESDAARLAERLEADNEYRRSLTSKVEEDVIQRIRAMDDWRDRGGFVLAGSDWDEGVLGIAASRVVDEFGRPAVLISMAGKIAKGSGRSVRGVHLKEQLDHCKSHLIRYGGHAQAVGLSLDPAGVDGFVAALSERLDEATRDLPKQPRLRLDGDLSLEGCSLELIDFFSLCEPFGVGNRTPVWRVREVTVAESTRFVGNGHLKLHVSDGLGAKGEAIRFRWGEDRDVAPESLHGRVVDLAVTLKKGYYLDRYYPELHVRDIRDHQT